MVRSVARDLPEQGKNNPAVNQAAGNGSQKMGQYSWFTVYVTKKQKTILSSFGLSDIDVKSIAMDIGKQLSGSPTIIDETATKEDEDDGEDTFDIID